MANKDRHVETLEQVRQLTQSVEDGRRALEEQQSQLQARTNDLHRLCIPLNDLLRKRTTLRQHIAHVMRSEKYYVATVETVREEFHADLVIRQPGALYGRHLSMHQSEDLVDRARKFLTAARQELADMDGALVKLAKELNVESMLPDFRIPPEQDY